MSARCAAGARWLRLLHRVRFPCGCVQWQCWAFLPCLDACGSKTRLLLMGEGDTRLSAGSKTHFQRAAGGGAGIRQPQPGHRASSVAAHWGF